MPYFKYPIPLTTHQIKQLRKAIDTSTPVRMRISVYQLGTNEGIPLLLSKSQINKAEKHLKMGKGILLTLSPTQIRYNKKEGGFLPILIPIAIALATGAASALGGFAANKAIDAIDKAIQGGDYNTASRKMMRIYDKINGEGLSPSDMDKNVLMELLSKFSKRITKGQGLTPFGTSGGEFNSIPGTDYVVKKANGLFPHGVKPKS